MASGNITREDIRHDDIVDAVELASDGLTSIIFTSATVVSTTSSTKTVVLSGVDLLRDPEIVEPGDLITLAGTSGGAADGDYTVATRVDGTSFTVSEAISDSTGGTCEAQDPSGARRVGFDSTGLSQTSATHVQGALADLDGAISAGGITAVEHRTLRQLIHFIDDGPAEGFASGAYRETTGTVFPTAVVWYTDDGKTDKIVERLITWTGASPVTDKWKIYDTDGSTVLWTVSDAIAYSGVFETDRTRTIMAGDA